MGKIIIETKRLLLREMEASDYDAIYKVLADSDIMNHYPYTFDGKRIKNWILRNVERYRVLGFGLWSMVEKSSGEMIGDCGITMQNINNFIRPEIGYHVRADKQKKGYATECDLACQKWMFQNTSFGAVYSYMHADNIPSRKVAEKSGMKLFETYMDEREGEVAVYEITREMFLGGKND